MARVIRYTVYVTPEFEEAFNEFLDESEGVVEAELDDEYEV